MQLVLRQSFPLGRFHATPWRVNPFDDAYGEWPPSPWRLARAVVARWYQWRREAHGTFDDAELDQLIAALCRSSYHFHLPPQSLRGEAVRQYHPVGWKAKKASGMRSYSTSLVQDNYWCVPDGEAGAVFWFIDGDRWTEELVQVLDCCLERIIYFGRAESLTRFDRPEPPPHAEVNCILRERRAAADAVRVLVPSPEATRRDIERVTADAAMTASVPPGARLMYARRPPRPVLRPRIQPVIRPPAPNLIQLAIGWHVAPEPRATARMTQRFRSAVLHELISIETKGRTGRWSQADQDTRSRLELMTGKDASGQPLSGDHRHAEFFIWWHEGKPTRLIVWRAADPFNDYERAAIWAAAKEDLSWQVVSEKDDPWRLRLVPLGDCVERPPGFNGAASREWCSMTPYVPPRHHLRGGKLRKAEAIDAQVRRELTLRQVCPGDTVDIEVREAQWVAVHLPHRHANIRPFLGDRRGYQVSLRFRVPVAGPIRLGHSASFGLGLFAPCC